MRSTRLKRIVLFMLIICFITGISGVAIGDKDDTKDFDVKFNIGFNGYFKASYKVPVKITITNNLKDIDGKFQLLFTDVINNQKRLYTAHTQELNIAKGATKELTMEANIDRMRTSIARILDDKGNEIWREVLPAAIPGSPDSISIGVLSDDIDSLNYFTSVLFPREGGNNYISAVANLKGYMPESPETLNMFSIIVVNDYDTKSLKDNQKKALLEWVQGGGTLLIGTGPNYHKTLSGLEGISYIKAGGVRQLDTHPALKTKSGEVLQANMELQLLDISSHDGKVLAGSEDSPLILTKSEGKGNILISAIDLGISPFINWNVKEKFLAEALESYAKPQASLHPKYGGVPTYHRVLHLIRSIPSERLPSFKMIIGIFIAFIIIIGPLNYLMLKAIDKREKIWITIPIIVVLFTSFIYVWGIGTRFDRPLTNNISFIQVANNQMNITTVSGVMGFSRGDIDVSVDKELSIEPLDIHYSHNYMTSFNDKDIIREYLTGKENHVIFKKAGMWDTQTVKVTSNKRLEEFIDHNLQYENGKIVGAVSNQSDIHLEDVIVIYGNTYKKLGDISAGEEKKVDIAVNQSTSQPHMNYYNVLQSIYPWGQRGGNLSNSDILNIDVKRSILEEYFERSILENTNGSLYLVAWNREVLSPSIKVNSKEPHRIDRNLIIFPLELSFEQGQEVIIPYDILNAEALEVHNLHRDYRPGIYYGNGHVVFGINPKLQIDISTIEIDLVQQNIVTNYEIEIYNYENDSWETYKQSTLTINNLNMDKYYDDVAGVKIKIKVINGDIINEPRFSVKGVAQ